MESKMESYCKSIQPHGINRGGIVSVNTIIDFAFRTVIGKTDEITIGLCSHAKTIQRELKSNGVDLETRCRQCGIPFGPGMLICNDYLFFRNENCQSWICGDCMKERPDIWYLKFKKAQKKLEKFMPEILKLVGGDAENVFPIIETMLKKVRI